MLYSFIFWLKWIWFLQPYWSLNLADKIGYFLSFNQCCLTSFLSGMLLGYRYAHGFNWLENRIVVNFCRSEGKGKLRLYCSRKVVLLYKQHCTWKAVFRTMELGNVSLRFGYQIIKRCILVFLLQRIAHVI